MGRARVRCESSETWNFVPNWSRGTEERRPPLLLLLSIYLSMVPQKRERKNEQSREQNDSCCVRIMRGERGKTRGGKTNNNKAGFSFLSEQGGGAGKVNNSPEGEEWDQKVPRKANGWIPKKLWGRDLSACDEGRGVWTREGGGGTGRMSPTNPSNSFPSNFSHTPHLTPHAPLIMHPSRACVAFRGYVFRFQSSSL